MRKCHLVVNRNHVYFHPANDEARELALTLLLIDIVVDDDDDDDDIVATTRERGWGLVVKQ
jgi:hypothetical protein